MEMPSEQQAARAIVAAGLVSTLGSLPVFLLAAQAVLIRSELGFNEARLGVVVAAFFATGALLSAPSGRLSERLGPRAGMLIASTATGVLLLVLAGASRRWLDLLVLLALAGAVNTLAQTSADLCVARGVPTHLQGLAYGVKTSCIPLATLLSGIAIPAVGVQFGWRWSFALVAVLTALVRVISPSRHRFKRTVARRGGAAPDATASALVTLALAGGLSVGAVNTMSAFYAEAAIARGLSPGAAGWWLAMGSVGAVIARILFAARGDRFNSDSLRVVALLWLTGAAGIGLLALGGPLPLLAVGTAVAFIAGSGWPGLFLTAVVRSNPSAPAAASGIVMTGHLGGSVVGPLAFGALVSGGSYTMAWAAMAGALVLAAALVPSANRLLAKL